MKRKRHTPQEIIAKLREAEVESSLAASVRRDERAGDGAYERARKMRG
jgi:hypothetical protein